MIFFSCSEIKNNDKKWLIDQEVFKEYIDVNDSIINIKFNLDTNEINFEIVISEDEAKRRDSLIIENWEIRKEKGLVIYSNKKLENEIIVRYNKEGKQNLYYLGDNFSNLKNIISNVN
jgi:hypothetical protein